MIKFLIFLSIFTTSPSIFADRMSCNIRTSSYDCLVCNCFHESRGEPMEGKIAVLKTVMSRHEDKIFNWPDSICGIVYDDGQFSWTQDKFSNNISVTKDIDIKSLKDCRQAANIALDEGSNGIIFFNNPKTSSNAWAFKRGKNECGRIDNHVFYVPRGQKCPKNLGANNVGSSNSSLRNQNKSSSGKSAK